jgi:hypothetical protein
MVVKNTQSRLTTGKMAMSACVTADFRDPPVRSAADAGLVGVVANHGYQFIKNYCPRPPVLTAR